MSVVFILCENGSLFSPATATAVTPFRLLVFSGFFLILSGKFFDEADDDDDAAFEGIYCDFAAPKLFALFIARFYCSTYNVAVVVVGLFFLSVDDPDYI